MLKDLKKQIEAKKQEIIRPVKEKFEIIFQGHSVVVDFDTEGSMASLSTKSLQENTMLILNFVYTEEEKLFTNYSFKYEKDGDIIIAAKPVPFTIDYQVLNFVFYELSQILESLKEKPAEDE